MANAPTSGRRGRWLAAAGVAVALLLGTATAAQAADPSPGSGPTSGGTQVTVTAPSPSSFAQVTAGNRFSVALDSGGYAYAWGYNYYGQLGDGTTTSSSTPDAVKMPTGVTFTQISSGKYHSLALGSNGKVYAWGWNGKGQLGDGTTTNRSTPVPVQSSLTFVQIAAGQEHSLAITSDGKVYAWGSNSLAMLGDGTTTNRSAPVPVQSSQTFTQISAGISHSLALASNGRAYGWGNNAVEQFLLGGAAEYSSPVMMSGSQTFTQVSAGYNYSLALTSDGKISSWGTGNGGSTSLTFTQISAGYKHSLALATTGKAYAWGESNYAGEFGNGSTELEGSSVLVPVSGSRTFAQLSAGFWYSLALTDDGKAYSWGRNEDGQLGNGSTTNRSTPGAVSTPAVVVTKVTFGGTAGTALTKLDDGKWQVTTPARANPGKVNVVMSWTLGGTAQTAITFVNGFTYLKPVPEVEVTIAAYEEGSHETEIPPDSIVAPGTTLYFVYAVENTGAIPVSIRELKHDADLLDPDADCDVRELGAGESTTCYSEATL